MGKQTREETRAFDGCDVQTRRARLVGSPTAWGLAKGGTEQAYPNLIYFNELDRGNHFEARQEPELLTTEIHAGFRSLR
jgi:hypothetical protein